jgi:NitT/TauT family transport system substrate-binding protein
MRKEIAVITGRALTRRRFLGGAAVAGFGLAALDGLVLGWPGLPLSPARPLRWISPRGALDVMDDYPLWTARQLGYFRLMGIEAELLPGPHDPDAATRALAAGEADIGFPAPDALVRAVDRGLPLRSVFQLFPSQVFTLAVPEAGPIQRPAQLAGKTIAVGSRTWRTIVEPMLLDAGIDPRTVRYLEGGPAWGSLVSGGRADAALVWDGLHAAWTAQGVRLRSLPWERWSRLPSNSYVVRAADLGDPARRDLHRRFLAATVMGLEFARQNPRAAAQLTYRSRPHIANDLGPQRALDAMLQVARGYGAGAVGGAGWGVHEPDRWRRYAAASAQLGYTKPIPPTGLFTNELVASANAVDRQRIREDALEFVLDRDFSRTHLSGGAQRG